MIPIAALGERQTWRDGDCRVNVRCDGDRLRVQLTRLAGYDGELPASETEDAWFERATVGVHGVSREPGPSWTMPPDAWPTIVARLCLSSPRRTFGYERPGAGVTALLAAELRGRWSATLRWGSSAHDHVFISVGATGWLGVACNELQIAALREHTGLALDARNAQGQWTVSVEPARAVELFERVASWSPETLASVQAEIDG